MNNKKFIFTASFFVFLNAFLEPALAENNLHKISNFSESRLRSLGIDPSIAEYLSKKPRFPPGKNSVELIVNGIARGITELKFSKNGDLCASKEFFIISGMKEPNSSFFNEKKVSLDADQCILITSLFPLLRVYLKPSEQEVKVLIPVENLENKEDSHVYKKGGEAAILNYSAYHSHVESFDTRNDYSYIGLESGFNYGDWIFRGSQSLSKVGNRGAEFDNSWFYAQKTLLKQKRTFQIGQINFSNPIFSSVPIEGIQMVPETALRNDSESVEISGVAQADQSKVEIEQGGIRLITTLVPAGPFTLTNVKLVNYKSDVLLVITSPNGGVERTSISIASLQRLAPKAPDSWSFAVGKARTDGLDVYDKQTLVASLSNGWGLTNRSMLEAGAVGATAYFSSGAGLIYRPTDEVAFGISAAMSQDRNHHVNGAKGTITAGWNMPRNFSVNGDMSAYSAGYRELPDSIFRYDSSYGAISSGFRLGWGTSSAGNFSFSMSQTRQSYDSSTNRRLILAWNKKLSRTNLSVNWQHQERNDSICREKDNCRDRNSLYLSLSIPFSEYQSRAYYRKNENSNVTGLQVSGGFNENDSWSLSKEIDGNNNAGNISGSLNSNLHYTSGGIYAYMGGSNVRNYSTSLSGGVIAHKEGLIFSPYKVDDTFGVISVYPKVSGVEIATPNGKIWTDWRGKAVASSLPAYKSSFIEVNTEKLPDNVDLDNGLQQFSAGRGAVIESRFILKSTRNALLNIKLADGSLLPKGSTILTSDGSYVTMVVDPGFVFLSDLNRETTLVAKFKNVTCKLSFTIPVYNIKEISYEKIEGSCI